MDPACYFDNAATTPVDSRVVEAMLPHLKGGFGNASSIHAWGREACEAVTKAREQVAKLIQADDPSEIVFTSGATESNNWILRSVKSLAISPFEHDSVRHIGEVLGAKTLKNKGWKLEDSDADLTSVMLVNNETGAILGMPKCKTLHSDATQAVGKIPFDAKRFDFASMSAHKFYGPKGVGALYIRGGKDMAPLLFGGEHEHGRRSGTLNVPGIVGMGRAVEVCQERLEADYAHAANLRGIVKERLSKIADVVFVEAENQSPYILSTCFPGLEGETLVISLDARGFAVGSGSACSSGSGATSKVLKAYGLDDRVARGAVRFSFGRLNTVESAQALCACVEKSVENLRKLFV